MELREQIISKGAKTEMKFTDFWVQSYQIPNSICYTIFHLTNYYTLIHMLVVVYQVTVSTSSETKKKAATATTQSSLQANLVC